MVDPNNISCAARDEIARILQLVADGGLDRPRDMDAAIDALLCALDTPEYDDD